MLGSVGSNQIYGQAFVIDSVDWPSLVAKQRIIVFTFLLEVLHNSFNTVLARLPPTRKHRLSPTLRSFRERLYDTAMAAEGPDLSHRDPESITEERTKSLLTIIRCGNFRFPCISSRRRVGLAWWERIRLAQIQSDGQWWSRGVRVFKKIRDWSEIVAGPRWKTFIRRFNRNCSGGARHGKFQYDPLSYSLNFEGENSVCEDEYDDFSRYRNFSARYAAVPVPLRITSNAGTSKGATPVPVAVYG